MSDPFQERLAELRRRDPEFRVFGASMHLYDSKQVSMPEVARFEEAVGASLPPEYRKFLLNVGYGAGPYYGIWGPNGSLTEFQPLARDYESEHGGHASPAVDFPLSASDMRKIEAELAAGIKLTPIDHDWPCSGCIPICHQGCTFWTVLVLRGEFIGRVFDVANFVGYSGEFLPARRPPGLIRLHPPKPRELPPIPSPPTFREWFAAWIERCLTDLADEPRK